MRKRRCCAALLALAACDAHAHGFGQRYDLPIPLILYACGAALTIVVSCVMLAMYVRTAPREAGVVRIDVSGGRGARASAAIVAALRGLAVAIYAFVLFAGFFGHEHPFRNIVPVTVWAVWWVGMAYVSALAGDAWALANPLETLFAAAERAFRRWTGRLLSLGIAPPAWLGAWPAVVLYLAFLWMEVAWDGSDSPRAIAAVVVAYSLLTWAGMAIFGREAWLERGEAFGCVFGVIARFAPLRAVLRDRRVVEWQVRPYAVGLLQREPLAASRVALVLMILAAVSFDGFLETPAWAAVVEAFAAENEPAAGLRTAGLLAAPLVFGAVFLVFSWLIALSGADPGVRARRIAGLFVLTLVPIAIAYQVAHYLSFLVQAGQYLIPLASDPFGWGWDLFGTRAYFVRFGIIDARLVWIVSVVAIVAGHIAALYLGHVLSLREYRDARAAVRSQGPMLVLMVAYTMLSLWIIAQPIVSTR